jgi:hypothetical protein
VSARPRYGSTFIPLVAALVTALGAARAQAYVRSKTDAGNPFYWKESCVPVTIYLNGFEGAKSGMTVNELVKSVVAAAHTWSTDAVSCCPRAPTTAGGCSSSEVTTSPYLEIVPSLAPASAAPPVVAWDALNAVIFRTQPEMWSKSGVPGQDYPPEALAVTTVTARLDGHIVDVDMEINGVTQQWMNLDPGVSIPFNHGATEEIFDLQNALTHEFGHFIGLDHTCFIPSMDGSDVSADGKLRPKDDQGNDVPDCDASPADIQNTVMFNVTMPGETSKRTLSPDDVNAVCDIYAASIPHEACALDSANPGCAVAPTRPSRRADRGWVLGLSAGALAIVSALVARRRR